VSRFIRCVLFLCSVYILTTAPPALAKTVPDDSASPSFMAIADGSIPTDRPQGGFCRNGVYDHPLWPPGGPPSGVVAWGSYCQSGDDGLGWTASKAVIADSFFSVYLAGYPGSADISLAVENLQSGRQLPLQTANAPGDSWRLFHFPLPSEWKGQPVRLLVEDQAARPDGWVGFTEPDSMPGLKSDALFAGRILGLTLVLFVVLMLPPGAMVITAFLRGVKDPLDLTTVALLAMGFVGYAAFWTYFFSRMAGITYSYVILLSSCAVIVYAGVTARNRRRLRGLRRMAEPVVLMGLASVFVISLGFVYGRPVSVQDYAAQRFGPPSLWIDNFLPKLFADGIFQGHVPRPLASDWLSSDRPPLQTGMVIWIYPGTHGIRELPYQTAATILQLTFLAGLWAYLEAAKVNRKAMALALATAFVSGFVILNSFYTWPKLLPVAFFFILPAYLFTDRFSSVRANWRVGASIGAAAGLAMLCHGGSMFALLGIALTLLFLRRLPSPRFLLAAALAAGLLYLPWMIYQKHYDPPGDRLLKMHLAGVVAVHPEAKLRDLLINNYSNLHARNILEYKLRNFSRLGEDTLGFWKNTATLIQSSFTGKQMQRAEAVAFLRNSIFLHWFSSIDIVILAPLALFLCAILGWHSTEFQQACRLWLCTAITLTVWCLLMFGPGTTVVHQGCYLTEVAAFAGGTLAFWALSPRLATIVTTCHVLFNAALYVWLTPPRPPGFATFMGPLNPVLSFTCFIAAACFALVLWRMAFGRGATAQDDEVNVSANSEWRRAKSGG
jgi:hypothetical protein